MPIDRRSFVKASGVAAAMGVTGLAGCSGFLGGGSGATNWQYDPATLSETQTRVFGSMQYGDLYSMRDQLPSSMSSNLDAQGESPINPGDIDLFTGVGGGQLSMETGSGSFFGSAAVTGSFDADAVGQELATEESTTKSGEYEGYTLYQGENLSESVPGSTPAQSMDAAATIAVSDGAIVFGVSVAQGSDLGVSGRQTVETMIDAEAGNAPRLAQNSDYAKKIQNKLGGSMIVVGGEVDEALVQAYQQQSGGMGANQQMTNGLRAGGFSGDIGADTTTYEVAIVYDSSGNAESSQITQSVNRMSGLATQQEGLKELSASRNGDTIVVTMKGDTKTLLSAGQSQVPMGATSGVGGASAIPLED